MDKIDIKDNIIIEDNHQYKEKDYPSEIVNTDNYYEDLRTQERSLDDKKQEEIFLETVGNENYNTEPQTVKYEPTEEELKVMEKMREKRQRDEKEKRTKALKGIIRLRKMNKQITDNLYV